MDASTQPAGERECGDIYEPHKRSEIMARVRSRHTKPEVAVRSMLHAGGYRFRLHRKDLPGKPDLVLPRHRAVVFVHGCFWHGHTCRKGGRPASNRAFWDKKLDDNLERDVRKSLQLAELGWNVVVVWECELRDPDRLLERLRLALASAAPGEGSTRVGGRTSR